MQWIQHPNATDTNYAKNYEYNVRQKYIVYAKQNTKMPYKTQSTPTKIPNMPNKTPCAQFQSKEYAKKTNIGLRCFVAMQFLSQIYALFWRIFYRPKNLVAYQKWQIWGMPKIRPTFFPPGKTMSICTANVAETSVAKKTKKRWSNYLTGLTTRMLFHPSKYFMRRNMTRRWKIRKAGVTNGSPSLGCAECWSPLCTVWFEEQYFDVLVLWTQ